MRTGVIVRQRQFHFEFALDFAPRAIIKLSCVLELLQGVIEPRPSRPKLIALIDEGVIEGYFNKDLNCYFVFRDSFEAWLRRTAPPSPSPASSRTVAA